MSTIRTALVIGGGIAGPVVAMALHKAGIHATVHEAHPDPTHGVGGSLALAPNGLAALGVVDARDAVLDTALPLTGQTMAVGARRVTLPGLSGLPPLQMVHRGTFSHALREHAVARGIEVVTGARLVDATSTADGVTAHFADGATAHADVLIGADGVHSRVRTLIDPTAAGPQYTGLLGFEGIADHDVPAPNLMTFAFGARAYYLYWSLPDGRTAWGANLPRPTPMTSAEARAVPAQEWLDVLRSTYADDDPGGELMRTTHPDSLLTTGALHIMRPVRHWHRDRMVLVGDAVHAPSNSSGQGASLAIESAVELARCLRDLPDVAAALTAYERLRRRRVEGVAARAGKINHAKAPGAFARAAMGLMLPVLARTAMNPERTLGAEQRHEIDWAAPVA